MRWESATTRIVSRHQQRARAPPPARQPERRLPLRRGCILGRARRRARSRRRRHRHRRGPRRSEHGPRVSSAPPVLPKRDGVLTRPAPTMIEVLVASGLTSQGDYASPRLLESWKTPAAEGPYGRREGPARLRRGLPLPGQRLHAGARCASACSTPAPCKHVARELVESRKRLNKKAEGIDMDAAEETIPGHFYMNRKDMAEQEWF
ncbi:hypothetical protein LX36DRAFT_310970 [Colletotrichum falcatum]|nr:hypothetical protein LX36DRAFT_310970 [Colletotrichum falcatum]